MGHRLLGDCEMWGMVCEEMRMQYLYLRVFGATSSTGTNPERKGFHDARPISWYYSNYVTTI